MVRPLGIFFLSRVALIGAVAVARPFLILPSARPDPACAFGICEPIPLILAAVAMAATALLLWSLVKRDEGADAAASAVMLFLASPLSLVLAFDAAAAAATALSLLALALARRRAAWAAGLALAGGSVVAPVVALMIPAAVLAALAADYRGMRVNALLCAVPALLVVGLERGQPLVTAPWLQVNSLMLAAGAAGSLIHTSALAGLAVLCVVAFATRRFVAGLAGAAWLLAGIGLPAPVAAHLGACAVAPWGGAAVASRKWQLEAPLAAGLFMIQGLWLFHLVHGFRLL